MWRLRSASGLLGRAVGESFGAEGAIAGAIVVGLVDVDSVTIAMARLPSGILSLEGAAYAILAAVASDTVRLQSVRSSARVVSRHRSGSWRPFVYLVRPSWA